MNSSSLPPEAELNDTVDAGSVGGSINLWTNGLDKDEFEDFKRQLLSNTRIFNRLRGIIKSMYDSKRPSSKDFNELNYGLKRAFDDGYKAALSDIYKLLPLTKREQ